MSRLRINYKINKNGTLGFWSMAGASIKGFYLCGTFYSKKEV